MSGFVKINKNEQDYTLDQPKIEEVFLQFTPGIVTDVITSDECVAANDGSDTNCVYISSHIGQTLDSGQPERKKYKPLLRGISDTPVKGDQVLVISIGNSHYYLGPINTENNPCQNQDDLRRPPKYWGDASQQVSMEQLTGISSNFIKKNVARIQKKMNIELDDPNESGNILQHPSTGTDMLADIHGDLMIEGRHGNSIRIGSRNINPLIMISNGEGLANTQESSLDGSIFGMFNFGSLHQHFNNDGDAEGTEYFFRLADCEAEGATRTIENSFQRALGRGMGTDGEDDSDVGATIYSYGSLDFPGNQTFLSSDRIIFNARKDSVYISAFQHLHLGSANTMTLSTSNNVLMEAENSVVIDCPITKLGTDDDESSQPIVLGDTMVEKMLDVCDIMDEVINAINAMTHPTGVGPSGPPINASQFTGITNGSIKALRDTIEEILSLSNRTI
tara:strand:- start:3056 stop:4399 length:1344 start_codon:yes stop_codon:yes gene_type:complete